MLISLSLALISLNTFLHLSGHQGPPVLSEQLIIEKDSFNQT